MEQKNVSYPPLQPRPAGCLVPLTAVQLQWWNRYLSNPAGPVSVRMCAASVRISGSLNTTLLRRSIEAVVRRHESLRTRFIATENITRQHIDESREYDFEIIDLSKLSSDNANREARVRAQQFLDETIDLSIGPLFETKLFRLSGREYVLIMALDHMVSDTISCAILYREVWHLYNQAVQGQAFSLPELSVQFADYAVWQQRTGDAWLGKHESYWRRHLDGAPRLQLPLDDRSAKSGLHAIASLHFPFGKALSMNLRDVARRERIILPLVVLTIYFIVVSRWCNQRDLVLAFMSHGRHTHPELKDMIGFVATRLFLRIDVSGQDTFLDLLRRVNLELSSASRHQDFDRVLDLIPDCPNDLFFNWVSSNWPHSHSQEGETNDRHLRIQPYPMPRYRVRSVDASEKPLAAECRDTPAGIVMSVTYRPDIIARDTMRKFGQNVLLFAEELGRHSLEPVASVGLRP